MHRLRPLCRVAALALVLLASAGPARALTIFSDDFDSEPGVGSGSFPDSLVSIAGPFSSKWTVTSGTVDLISHGDYASAPGEIECHGGGGKCIDLDGSTSSGGTFESIVLNLQPGTYDFRYELSGVASSFTQAGALPDNEVEVSIGGLFSETVTRAKGDPYATFGGQFSVTTATNVKIVFTDPNGDNFGAMLDSVRLELIPEPGTATLLLGGLLGLALRRRWERS